MVKNRLRRISAHEFSDGFMRLKNWGLKGGLAVLDQGVYSGSNFLFNVFLARWLSADNYGAFSLAFAVFLFFSGFHNAMILEPMSVLGSANYAVIIRRYLSSQFVIHFVFTSALGGLALLAGYFLRRFAFVNASLSQAIVVVGLFLPLTLLMWFARRALYVLGEPGSAFFLSVVYSFCLLGGAYYFHLRKTENPAMWLGVMGAAGATGLLLLVRLDFSSWPTLEDSLSLKKLFAEQWGFGKWIVLAAFLNFAATQLQIFIAAGALNLNAVGAFRALQNFMLPMTQILSAIFSLALPSISFAFGQRDYLRVSRRSFMVGGILSLLSGLYVLFLFFLAGPMENLLYMGKYKSYIWVIPIIGTIPIVTALEVGFALIVRSLQRPIYYAILTFGMALAGILSGLFLIPRYGIVGAVASLIISAIASLCMNVWFYLKWFFADFGVKQLHKEI